MAPPFSRIRCSDLDLYLDLPETIPGSRWIHMPNLVPIGPAIWPTIRNIHTDTWCQICIRLSLFIIIILYCQYQGSLDILEQELSYRQQIARQLHTQYAEGIYRHKYYTVTLKSRLRVTKGHWKRNHWIDHTRLSSSRVIWRWILL